MLKFISKEGMRNSMYCYQLAECCIWNYENSRWSEYKNNGDKELICKFNAMNLNTLYF